MQSWEAFYISQRTQGSNPIHLILTIQYLNIPLDL